MRVVALVGSKGGCGKSSIAASIAAEAAKYGPVYLADLDPQQSLAAWWRLRQGPENPFLITKVDNVADAIEAAERRGEQGSWLIVDTPGSFVRVMREAIHRAHAIVVPVQPSPMDYLGTGAVEDLIGEQRAWLRTIFVLNRIVGPPTGIVKEMAAQIEKKAGSAPVRIANRNDYAKAIAEGKAGNEVNKDAEKEIRTLWARVREIAN